MPNKLKLAQLMLHVRREGPRLEIQTRMQTRTLHLLVISLLLTGGVSLVASPSASASCLVQVGGTQGCSGTCLVAVGDCDSCSGTCPASCTIVVGTCLGSCLVQVSGTCNDHGSCTVSVDWCNSDCLVNVGRGAMGCNFGSHCEINLNVCLAGGTCLVNAGTCAGNCDVNAGACPAGANCVLYVTVCLLLAASDPAHAHEAAPGPLVVATELP